MTTGFVAASVFLLDRIAKLLIQSTWQPGQSLLGGLIQPEYLSAQTITGNPFGGGLAVGAELFGLALAVLIALFWGGARQQRSHSVSLGFIIGALASNLFDQLAYGAVFNYLHVANLPTFSLAHAALLLGALLLAYSLLRGPHAGAAAAIDQSQAGANG
jgi:lipoprotein signal peptidase